MKQKGEMKMTVNAMQGHERPLTYVKFNKDGDLLFSCAKDKIVTVWFAENGERLGTYKGHNGVVWTCSINRDSSRLLTASADQTVKLWSVKTGKELHSFKFDSPVRSVEFSICDKFAVITTDQFMNKESAIHILRIAKDDEQQTNESDAVLGGELGRANRAVWGPLNKYIISGGDDAVLRLWDTESGKIIMTTRDNENSHKDTITSLCPSADRSHFLTGSLDKSAKLWDTRTLTLIKTYVSERPVNAVALSPTHNHIVLGGGQEAMKVTLTDVRAGKFEAKVYDKIFENEIGNVKGHTGPINALAFNPDGRRFASGGEEGFVRLHHFNPNDL